MDSPNASRAGDEIDDVADDRTGSMSGVGVPSVDDGVEGLGYTGRDDVADPAQETHPNAPGGDDIPID